MSNFLKGNKSSLQFRTYNNDYISDFMSCKNRTINKETEKMKETDDKIEKLVKILNIYPNQIQIFLK